MAEKIKLTEYDIRLAKEALAIAILAIEQVPPQFRPHPNHEMDRLLARLVEFDDELILYFDKARAIMFHDDAQ